MPQDRLPTLRQNSSGHNSSEERIAARLSAAADSLAQARDPDSFLAAMSYQRRLWHRMQKAAPFFSYQIPDRVMTFSLGVTAKPDGEWNDQEIEALISIDRTMSQAMSRAVRRIAD